MPCYASKDIEALKKTWGAIKGRVQAKLRCVFGLLGKNQYLINNQLSFVDFYLLEAFENLLRIEEKLKIGFLTD